jgi:ATP-binding cassette subfamily B multidrug efflux pump
MLYVTAVTSLRTNSIWPYLRPYRRRLWWGAVLLLVTNVLDKTIPWMLKGAVDSLQSQAMGRVRGYVLGVLGLAACLWFVRTASRMYVFNVGRDVEFDVRNQLLNHLQRLGSSFYATMSTGEIMSRATSDIGQVRVWVGFGILNIMNSVFAYTGALGFMYALSPSLTGWALCPYPFFVLVTRWFAKKLYVLGHESQKTTADLADRAQQNVVGAHVVRTYSLQEWETRRFADSSDRAVQASMRLVQVRGLMWPVLLSVGSVSTLVVIGVGGGMVIRGELTVGALAAFTAYLGQLVWPTLALGYTLSVIQRGRASLARVHEIMQVPVEYHVPTVPGSSWTPAQASPPRPAYVRVEGLSFRYPSDNESDADTQNGKRGGMKLHNSPSTTRPDSTAGTSVESHLRWPGLRYIHLELQPGTIVAMMGPTGSGKSTFARLLLRLHPVPPNTLFLDGRDVTDESMYEYRRHVSYAAQEPFLFSTTVRQNLWFGAADGVDDAEEEQLRALTRVAASVKLLDEIEALPQGWDTLVGERGIQLSGGQKQRLALARALLRPSRLLVLDDPLSAVDASTERDIVQTLRNERHQRTVLLITHRVSVASIADHIVMLEHGTIREQGTAQALMRPGTLFYNFAERQRMQQSLSLSEEAISV